MYSFHLLIYFKHSNKYSLNNLLLWEYSYQLGQSGINNYSNLSSKESTIMALKLSAWRFVFYLFLSPSLNA